MKPVFPVGTISVPTEGLKGGVQASLSDYRRSGFDRGHMAPAADMRWSATAMSESFYLTNICPQTPSLNQGDWNRLEGKIRDWARRDSAVVILFAVRLFLLMTRQ